LYLRRCLENAILPNGVRRQQGRDLLGDEYRLEVAVLEYIGSSTRPV